MIQTLLVAMLLSLSALLACSEPTPDTVTRPAETSQRINTIPPEQPAGERNTVQATTVPLEQTADARNAVQVTATPPPAPAQSGSTWRSIPVTPEYRCSHYDPDDYRYPQSVEPNIVRAQGGIYGPYTGTWFSSTGETDIEHIVARSEAHDSGLCAASQATKSAFASDLLNLTLASPSVNRHSKSDKDAAQWLPALNSCWYVNRIIQVRLKYGLTIDHAEAAAIDQVLSGCESTRMVVLAPSSTPAASETQDSRTGDPEALQRWDDNGNGRITCAEARAHGIAPVRRGHPAYEYMTDGDGDGMVCE